MSEKYKDKPWEKSKEIPDVELYKPIQLSKLILK